MNSLEGQESVLSVFGPISNSISGLKMFMEAVIKAKPWLKDPLAVRKKWDDDEYQLKDRDHGRKLCFAIMWDDGGCVPHPPIIRALKLVERALTNAGHNSTLIFMEFHRVLFPTFYAVVAWHPIKHRKLCDLTVCDVGLHLLEGEARCCLSTDADMGRRLCRRLYDYRLENWGANHLHHGSGQ